MTPTAVPVLARTRVAVVRALAGPGEVLCLVPALRALRAGRPEAHVTVVGLPSGRWLAARRPDLVDDWIDLPAWPGVTDADGEPARTLALLASSLPAFDLVLQLHGPGGPVNRLAQLLSAGSTVVHVDNRPVGPHGGRTDGRSTQGLTGSWPRLVERQWPLVGHEVDRLLGLVTSIGAPARGRHLDLPELDDDVDAAATVWRRLGGRPFVVVHPSARRAAHRWDAMGFAAVARSLATDGWAVVVTGGGMARERVARVALQSGVSVVPTLDLPFGALAAVLRRASALVTSDVDLALVAQGVGCPVGLVAVSVDLERWGPLGTARAAVTSPTGDLSTDVRSVLVEVQRLVRRAPRLPRDQRGRSRPSGRLASPG